MRNRGIDEAKIRELGKRCVFQLADEGIRIAYKDTVTY